jgi:2-oxoglutarate ferredoxin oxidoreductase subunit alpha
MAEALGWAGINEVPLVVSLYQRAGPSTGLPTRHEQGDLLFAINAGHGEFPRIVFASGDIEESFYDTLKVFNFAEIFQLPVIHLLDKAIASSVMTCKNFEAQHSEKLKHFKRFELKENTTISPRPPLGTENGIFWNTGDEHDEQGHISEDPTVRIKMMDKRMGKLNLILQEIQDEDKALSYNGSSDIVITSWGSTKGAILDTLDELNKEGIKIKFVQVKLLNPFPQQLLEKMLNSAKTIINIEMNYSSQLAKLIKQNLHRDIDYEIVKYNGRPISCDELYRIIKEIVNNNTDKRRIVLDYGT